MALGVGSASGEIITPELNHTVHSHVLSYRLETGVSGSVRRGMEWACKKREKNKKAQGDGAGGLDNQQFLI